MRTRRIVLLLSMSTLIVGEATIASFAQQGGPPDGLKPGDVVVDQGQVSVVVPKAGITVHAEALLPDGAEQLEVSTSSDGSVTVTDWGSESDSQTTDPSSAGGTDECDDDAYRLSGGAWNETMDWRFRDGSAPSEITQANAIDKIREATTNITHANNNCEQIDNISATANYLGVSQSGPNISVNSTCTDNDNNNRVSFGDLASGHLGYACWWWDGNGNMLDADFKLNKEDGYVWYTTEPANCSSRYSVEAVATHERGHTFGLKHPSEIESEHPNLTMSPAINGPCQNAESTLGLGDIRGLRQNY